jgi:hypothetical protein
LTSLGALLKRYFRDEGEMSGGSAAPSSVANEVRGVDCKDLLKRDLADDDLADFDELMVETVMVLSR